MGKDKKSKRKRREQDEIVDDESSNGDGSEDGAHSRDERGTWNTDDLYFDRNGRLVVRNPTLANAIARAVSEQGGIVVHMSYPDDGGRASFVMPIPKGPVPPWPNLTCPDMICGRDLNLVVSSKPMRDPPRDRSWESAGRPL